MKNELKLVILGMLYSDQIEYLKTINTNLNPDYDLTNNKFSCSAKLCLAYLTKRSNSNYCKFHNNDYLTLSGETLALDSYDQFSGSSIRRYINILSEIKINNQKTILLKDNNGIKVNRNKNKRKFTCILKFRNKDKANENNYNDELNKPSLIMAISFLLDKSAFHFVKDNSLFLNSSECNSIRKLIDVTDKTFKHDLKVLNKYGLINFVEDGVEISNSLFKEYLKIINVNIANREKEKCKEQEKTIIAANKENLIYDIAENTNTVIKSINQQSEELIKYLQLLINSVGYKLEKNLGKFKANNQVFSIQKELSGMIRSWEIFQQGVGNFSTQIESLGEIFQHSYIYKEDIPSFNYPSELTAQAQTDF